MLWPIFYSTFLIFQTLLTDCKSNTPQATLASSVTPSTSIHTVQLTDKRSLKILTQTLIQTFQMHMNVRMTRILRVRRFTLTLDDLLRAIYII